MNSKRRRGGFTLIELMIVVAILAILAVVAVPAFIKYMRRAKTLEALDQLDKIHKGAASYFTQGKVANKTGAPIPCVFPSTQLLTPDITSGICCGGAQDTDQDDRCDVDASQWDTAEWSALSFEMRDQHYFGYEFVSSGFGLNSTYPARAHADLDCDSVYSTFERYGYGTEESVRGDCSVKQASAFYKNLETE